MLTLLAFTFIYFISLTDKYINPIIISRLLGLGLGWCFLLWLNAFPVISSTAYSLFNGSFTFSYGNMGYGLSGFIILLAIIYLVTVGINWGKGSLYPYIREGITGRNNEYSLLILLNILAVVLIYSLNDYIVFALSIEILSITSYVVAVRFWSTDKAEIVKNSLQYFIISSFGTFLILLGIVFIYILTGTIKLEGVRIIMETWADVMDGSINNLAWAHVPLLIGMCIKAGVSPFHSWSLTLYTQNYLSVTFWMYVFTKLAYLPVILTVVLSVTKGLEGNPAIYLILLLGFANILIGSVSPYLENNLVRILIYSSLSHAGYMIWSMLYSSTLIGMTSFVFYLISYSITSFTLIYLVFLTKGARDVKGYPLSILDNLWNIDRWISILWILNLLSLIGVPPMLGFYGKFYVLTTFIDKGGYGIAILTILGSVVSAYYYLTLILRIFTCKENLYCRDLINLHPLHKFIVTSLTAYTTLYMFIPFSLYEFIEIILSYNYSVI